MHDMLAETAKMKDKVKKVESHHQCHLDLRQRAISTWVRDALKKDTEREETTRLNKEIGPRPLRAFELTSREVLIVS